MIDVSRLEWRPIRWKDPNGGFLQLIPYIPALGPLPTFKRSKRNYPLALLLPSEEIETWNEDARLERSSPGASAIEAITSGGSFGDFITTLSDLSGIDGPRFPDPVPYGLLRRIRKKQVFFIEPDVSDDDWMKWIESSIDYGTRMLRLLSMVFRSRKQQRAMRRYSKSIDLPEHVDGQWNLASAAACAWWQVCESVIGPSLALARDRRFASRLRGAVEMLRMRDWVDEGDSSNMILEVPIHQPWLPSIHSALNENPKPELFDRLKEEEE